MDWKIDFCKAVSLHTKAITNHVILSFTERVRKKLIHLAGVGMNRTRPIFKTEVFLYQSNAYLDVKFVLQNLSLFISFIFKYLCRLQISNK